MEIMPQDFLVMVHNKVTLFEPRREISHGLTQMNTDF